MKLLERRKVESLFKWDGYVRRMEDGSFVKKIHGNMLQVIRRCRPGKKLK